MSEIVHDEAQERELIEGALESYGFKAESWAKDPENSDRIQAVIGRGRVIEDDEDAGIYADDEGMLSAACVGAKEYGNLRVSFDFLPEGQDVPQEIKDPAVYIELD